MARGWFNGTKILGCWARCFATYFDARELNPWRWPRNGRHDEGVQNRVTTCSGGELRADPMPASEPR